MAYDQRLADVEAENERLRAVLTEIRDADPVDNALDPQRAGRIAAAALTGERS